MEDYTDGTLSILYLPAWLRVHFVSRISSELGGVSSVFGLQTAPIDYPFHENALPLMPRNVCHTSA